jgi:hypothetical protein
VRFAGHRKSLNVAYQTARTDLLDLAGLGVLEQRKRGRKMVFVAPPDLAQRLARLEIAHCFLQIPPGSEASIFLSRLMPSQMQWRLETPAPVLDP